MMITKINQLLLMALLLALAPLARGQTFELLYSFNGPDGIAPSAPLVQGTDGNFYGTTIGGGASNSGTVFKMTTNGALVTLVSFAETNGDGPSVAMVQGNDGDFYGTTEGGGTNDTVGTVFKVSTNGVLTSLFSFHLDTTGGLPVGKLLQWSDGSFFGTTAEGGTNLLGTIFKITTNGALTTLVTFSGTNGSAPWGGLLRGSDGNLYGTTFAGGINNRGTIFKMTTNGALTVLFSFNATNGEGSVAGLVDGNDGNFYGTTEEGGTHGRGTIFRINPSGMLTTLFSFAYATFPPDGMPTEDNGTFPRSGLIRANDGNFYGTTWQGGNSGGEGGTVYKITPGGQFTTLIEFIGANGRSPVADLVEGSDGNLYGTTQAGGANNKGTIFRIVMPVILNSRVSGDDLVLSWPTNHVGFILQSAADLNSATNWIDSTNAPAVVGAQFTVTNSISCNAQFYRLKK